MTITNWDMKLLNRRVISMKVKFVCVVCGKEPGIDEEKSTDNWKVYETVCKHCGGRQMKPIIE